MKQRWYSIQPVEGATKAPPDPCSNRDPQKAPKNPKFSDTLFLKVGARLRGRTATQRSKKGSEKVLGRVLGKGFWEGSPAQKGFEKGGCYGFYSKKGSEKGV